jgi:TolA-binding protein
VGRALQLESQAPRLHQRSIGVAREKKSDGVEAVLRKADRKLDDWFRQSRMTTRQASIVFGRFLQRTKRRGAGALRQQLEGLQGGLEKLSTGLEKLEHDRKAAAKKTRPSSASTRKTPRSPKKKAA